MKIGVIGYGNMAEALAGRWSSAHEVVIGGRDSEKASALAERIGGGVRAVGGIADTCEGMDTVLFATRFDAVAEFLPDVRDGLRGKIVIDINNPVRKDPKEPTDFLPSDEYRPSYAEWLQGELPDARVVKAFNQCQARVWSMQDPVFGGQRLVVPICGDDTGAKDAVASLARDLGCETFDFGPLARSPQIEGMATLMIQLLFSGFDPETVFNLIRPESETNRL